MGERYELIIEREDDPARAVPLPAEGIVAIGRHTDAGVVLGDYQASRRHAELTCQEGRFWLRDLGSANGTLIGGRPIGGMVQLRPGDSFVIGATTLRLALAEGDATGLPPARPSTATLGRETAIAGDDRTALHAPAGNSSPTGIGATLNGRYRLDRLLGRGGFAQVFLATDLSLRRQVAVKVLHAELTGEGGQEFLARFAQEARAVAALDHPNILGIHDYGEALGTVYIVMPYVDGGTLHDRLKAEKRLSPEMAGRYLRQVAAALDYAHRRQLVHRDIKPQNMLLRAEGDQLLLSDFGIAKAISGTDAQSRTGVLGTLAYMAPEQFEGIVSPATDIYALGCVLFQLLTGQVPFEGSTEQVIFSHLQGAVPRLAERHAAGLPPAIQGVLERALAKRQDARYRTAGEFAAAYDAALAGQASSVAPGAFAATGPDATQIAPERPSAPRPNDGGATVIGGGSPPGYGPGGTAPLPGYYQQQGQYSPPGGYGGPAPPVQPVPPPRGGRRAFVAGAAGLGALALVAAAGGGALVLRSRGTAAPTATPAATAGGAAQAPSAQPSAAPPAATSAPPSALSSAPPLSSAAASTLPSAQPTVAPSAAAGASAVPNGPRGTEAVGPGPSVAPTAPPPTAAPAPPTVAPTVAPAPSSAPPAGGFAGEAGQVLRGHAELVEAVAFSPDGRLLASGADDNTARIWRADGQTVATLSGHSADVNGVAWSPDSGTLATASGDKTLRLWNASGTFQRALSGHTDVIMASAWLPDGRTLVSASWDGTLRLWNPATGAATRTIQAHGAKIWSLAVASADLIASGSEDKTIKLWRGDGTPRATLSGHTDIVWGLASSPDGTLLASGSRDGTLRLWTSAGQASGTLLRGTPGVASVAWSPNGKLIACGLYDGTIAVITPTGQAVATCRGHSGYVAGVAWLADSSRLASGGQDTTVRLWR